MKIINKRDTKLIQNSIPGIEQAMKNNGTIIQVWGLADNFFKSPYNVDMGGCSYFGFSVFKVV